MPGLLQRVLGRRAHAHVAMPPPPAPADTVPEPAPEPPTVVAPPPEPEPEPEPPPAEEPDAEESWRRRSGMRRRLRYLRRARELALRDLGGLVFDLDRFGRERPDLMRAKLDALSALDRERRALEAALDDRHEVDVLREPGIASCPRCGSLHASEARFCSNCGLPVGPGAALPPGPAATLGDGRPEPVPGAAAATTDTPAT
jgi:hypothetical protein